jgi:hypothetical protein
MAKRQQTSIRVGQRLIRWDGQKGYVDTNSQGKTVYGPGEAFQVIWLDHDGTIEDAQHVTLEDFASEGIRRGRGVMPWAR